jgi:hypothetical protein
MATKRSIGVVGIGVALSGILACAAAVASGCVSSSAAPPSEDAGGFDSAIPALDATTTDGSTAADSAPSGDGGAPTDAAKANDGAVALSDAAGVLGTINLPDAAQPTSLVIDSTNAKLYVGMADPNTGNNLGLAVVDTTTNTVTATIPPIVTDAGLTQPYFNTQSMAVDPTANVLYAVQGGSATVVDVFNGATNAFQTSFNVSSGSLTAPCDSVTALAVDPAGSRLYAYCLSNPPSDVEIAVFNTTNDALVTSFVLEDLPAASGALALDTTNHLLFATSGYHGSGQPVLVDVINTTLDLEDAGTQQNLGVGTSIGAYGQAGFATVATVLAAPDGGDAAASTDGVFYSLEPGSTPFPTGFLPQAYAPLPGKPGYYVALGTAGGTLSGVVVKVSATEGTAPQMGSGFPFATPTVAGTSVELSSLVASASYVYLTAYLYLGTGSMPSPLWFGALGPSTP